ncbi:MAG: Tryptophanyl-tRNA synthetase [uncultured Acidimicrobiales bacterium]|uniref:Tryptophan--tRNA ligase n=1 Tax=uncultured Acidimicrobiales bacterium TaxID=310071 RepID=A0A6J4HN85_9ACTN|nr:MAG: Tryptophanyl-tRNA synthetase [uncultured Acidimicrobiales bacterium]
MGRVLSGIQPTGSPHLGSYLGAVRQWAAMQDEDDCFYTIVDLHALINAPDPAELRTNTLELATAVLAAGVDPDRCALFAQSHVPAHTEMGWVMECTVSFGELSRMTQFKSKAEGREFVSAGLFTYPALQAADILLYDADRVPVGDDQRQHLELARDAATRFNSRYGDVLVVPKATIPEQGARVMDLQDPTSKMSKSATSPQGTIDLLDTPSDLARKVKRAVTDTEGAVRYDPVGKPGVSNLLDLLSAATGEPPDSLADRYTQYGPLKSDVAEALNEMLAPFRKRLAELQADPAAVPAALALGREKASAVADATLTRVRDAVGLLPR